jgi:hypothetical protein
VGMALVQPRKVGPIESLRLDLYHGNQRNSAPFRTEDDVPYPMAFSGETVKNEPVEASEHSADDREREFCMDPYGYRFEG